jgi:hypothetical protein
MNSFKVFGLKKGGIQKQGAIQGEFMSLSFKYPAVDSPSIELRIFNLRKDHHDVVVVSYKQMLAFTVLHCT